VGTQAPAQWWVSMGSCSLGSFPNLSPQGYSCSEEWPCDFSVPAIPLGHSQLYHLSFDHTQSAGDFWHRLVHPSFLYYMVWKLTELLHPERFSQRQLMGAALSQAQPRGLGAHSVLALQSKCSILL
jgi:hypothetical protein